MNLKLNLCVCLQDKLKNMRGEHSDVLESLTPVVRKRVEVLRSIQVIESNRLFYTITACLIGVWLFRQYFVVSYLVS